MTPALSRSLHFRVLCVLLLFSVAPLSGCASWTGKDGVRHSLILGVGVVSALDKGPVQVQDLRAGGLTVGPDLVSVGFAQRHEVEIDPEKAGNAVISVKARPFGLDVRNFDPFPRDEWTSNTIQTDRRKTP
jgi:hypothetical protein